MSGRRIILSKIGHGCRLEDLLAVDREPDEWIWLVYEIIAIRDDTIVGFVCHGSNLAGSFCLLRLQRFEKKRFRQRAIDFTSWATFMFRGNTGRDGLGNAVARTMPLAEAVFTVIVVSDVKSAQVIDFLRIKHKLLRIWVKSSKVGPFRAGIVGILHFITGTDDAIRQHRKAWTGNLAEPCFDATEL